MPKNIDAACGGFDLSFVLRLQICTNGLLNCSCPLCGAFFIGRIPNLNTLAAVIWEGVHVQTDQNAILVLSRYFQTVLKIALLFVSLDSAFIVEQFVLGSGFYHRKAGQAQQVGKIP